MKRTALALALVAAVSCPAQNLIRNPEFQTVDQNGKLTDWKYDPKEYVLAKSDRPEENGKQVVLAKLTAPAEGSGKTRVSAHLRQRIQVKEAGKYQLTLVGKVIGTGVINCSWTFLDQNGKRIPVKGSWWSKACYGGSGKTGWQTVSEVLEIPAGTKSIEFCVTSYVDSKFKHKEGSMFIDRVYLAPVTGNQADGKK